VLEESDHGVRSGQGSVDLDLDLDSRRQRPHAWSLGGRDALEIRKKVG
jgi:hypothetical protein